MSSPASEVNTDSKGVAKVTRAFVHRETGLVADEVAAIEELVGDKAEGGQERKTA